MVPEGTGVSWQFRGESQNLRSKFFDPSSAFTSFVSSELRKDDTSPHHVSEQLQLGQNLQTFWTSGALSDSSIANHWTELSCNYFSVELFNWSSKSLYWKLLSRSARDVNCFALSVIGVASCMLGTCNCEICPGKWYGTLMLGNSCLSPICKWWARRKKKYCCRSWHVVSCGGTCWNVKCTLTFACSAIVAWKHGGTSEQSGVFVCEQCKCNCNRKSSCSCSGDSFPVLLFMFAS